MRRSLFLTALALFLIGGTLHAQGTASIDGTVVDSTDAAVPGASVTLTNLDTGVGRSTVSSAQGYFTFPDLRPGKYAVKVSSSGFQAWEQRDILLNVDQHATLRPLLQIGALTQTVEVTAAAPLVTVSQSSISSLVNSNQIEELPLNGRNALQLVQLAPGVVSTGTLGQYGVVQNSYATSGGRDINVNYSLDGGVILNPFYASPSEFPNPDALQEFSLTSRNYSSEYGRGTSTVTAVMRSGTNNFHGSAYEFLRNTDLDSRPFFSANRPTYLRNQYGASFGGPIRKNKLFFFGDYQGTKVRGSPSSTAYTTLTAAERTGNFSALSTHIINPATGQQFTGNVIPAGDIEAPATNTINTWLPLPNLGSNAYNYTPFNQTNENQVNAKVDYAPNDRDHFSVSEFFESIPQIAALAGGSGLDSTWKSTLPVNFQTTTLSYVHTFSPTLLNDARVTFLHTSFGDRNLVNFSLAAMGYPIQLSDVTSFGLGPDSELALSGYFSAYPNAPTRDIMATWRFADNMSWVRGIHSVNAGMELYRNRVNEIENYFTGGYMNFNGQFSGNAASDFLLGDFYSYRQIQALTSRLHQTLPSFYVQDDIKLTRRVTLNAGLRWDPVSGYNSQDSQLATFRPGTQSSLFPLMTPGLLYPGDDGLPFNVVGTRFDNLAPRVGVAWDVFGNGKTSIRAGAGVFYIPLTRGITFNRFTLIQPFVLDYTVSAGSALNIWAAPPFNGTGPFPRPFAGNLAALKALPYVPGGGESSLALPFKTESYHQWSFSVQQALWRNAVLEADYIGSDSEHIMTSLDGNPAVYGPGATEANTLARRLDPLIGANNNIADILTNNYNSLQITFRQRTSHGVTLQSYYTYSKTLGIVAAEGEGSNGPRDPFDRELNYGPETFDLRDNWVSSILWEPTADLMPSNKFVGGLVKGWGLNGIATVQTGPPLTLTSGVDNSFSDIGSDTPDQIGSWQLPGGRSKGQEIQQWFNQAAFQKNAIGTFGTLGEGALRSPGLWNLDAAALRTFVPHEGFHLEFRASFFNIFNHANLGAPTSTFTSPNFGKILTTTGNPRQIEFGLRLTF